MSSSKLVQGATLSAITVTMLAIVGCNDSTVISPFQSAVPRATVTFEVPATSGGVIESSRQVSFDRGNVGQISVLHTTESLVQIALTARAADVAPVGRADRTQRGPDGTLTQVHLERTEAGAPYSRVEIRDGAKLLYIVDSEWERQGENFVLIRRKYERFGTNGEAYRSSISFRSSSDKGNPNFVSTGFAASRIASNGPDAQTNKLDLSTAFVITDDCDGGGVIRHAGIAMASMEEPCEGGHCVLKFLSMTAAGAAATLLGTASTFGLIATAASGGALTPVEAGLVTAYFLAEGLFLDRLDNYLNCLEQ